jgi:putative spermidine/putrescine transport system ATP-binding protein/spermidine/putrescine transport system ATP-binding protein
MSDLVLELQNVTKRFGAVTAVDGISLAVTQHEFFALLGPSGSGKTTMLRLIAGLEAPDEGKVLINGQDVTALPPYARGVGMVFQNFLLFPHKTVAENVIFPLRMQGASKADQAERLKWALDLLRLQGLGDRYPHQLSGGQQQRVALARGLISRPALLLLDEPLANLDRELRKEMEVEVRRYQVELGIPFIYVTHNQEEALTMSDRIAVMNWGQFEQVAPKLEVYTHPTSRFVAGFVGHSNQMSGTLSSNNGVSRISWNGADVQVMRPDGVVDGAPVDCFVKCEKMRLSRPGEPGPAEHHNRLPGVLRDIIFKGSTADYLVALDNGAELMVSETSEVMTLQRDQRVEVIWPVAAGACFATPKA